MQQLITSSYEHQLAYHYHQIDKRGLLINVEKRDALKLHCEQELQNLCDYLTNFWGIPVYVGVNNKPDAKYSLNINSPAQMLEGLKDYLKYDVPKIRKKNKETDEYEYEDSVGELALVKLLADPLRWPSPQSGDGIKKLLNLRELITFKNRYLNAKLFKDIYFSSVSVASTKTGRRGSKKNIYGLGGNNQNFPARGTFADGWKDCIIARPGRLFFFVDQVSAEDWPVQALANNTVALDEMRRGVNRHYNFAAQIFGILSDDLRAIRNDKVGLFTKEQHEDAEMKYYVGKKGRHSNNYGMQPTRMSETLALEAGLTLPVDSCKNILSIIDRIDPNVKRVFHKYIQEELSKPTHLLRTPLGRERQFLGLRSGEKNYNIYNEAFAWIPQSLVGDNTGLAIVELEKCNDFILQDGHDSLCQEPSDRETELRQVFTNTKKAFSRRIVFHNGVEIEIPIEGQIGYNWKDKVKLKEYTEECLIDSYKELKEKYGHRTETTCTTVAESSSATMS